MTRTAAMFLSLVLVVSITRVASAKSALHLERYRPYTAKGKLQPIGRAILRRQYAAAARMLERLLRHRHVAHRKQTRFLLGYASFYAKNYLRAAAIFDKLSTDFPLLASYCNYFAARAFYKRKNFARTEELARRIAIGTILGVDAQLIRADALRALGRATEAIPLWRSYLKRRPGGARVAEAHLRLATAARKAADDAEKRMHDDNLRQTLLRRALHHYKAIISRHPLARQVKAAQLALRDLRQHLPNGDKAITLSGPELLARSRFFSRKQRNRRAEHGFAAALKHSDLTPSQRCQATYSLAKSIFKQRQRARATPHFAQAAVLCRNAQRPEIVVKSLYNQARGLFRSGKFLAAAKLFLALEREFPKHSYADDARLRAAEAYAELKRTTKVRSLLSSLPKRHPSGDQRREALWRLAHNAYERKRYSAALTHLNTIINTLGPARRYYAEGRALYWKGRILWHQGKRHLAIEAYEQTIRRYPLSYYALVAFNRLRERAPNTFRRLWRQLIAPIGKHPGRWTFAHQTVPQNASFRRGAELLRLGLGHLAARELVRAGLSTRRGPPERLWLAAVLFDHAGQWALAHQVPRSRDWRWKHAYPLKGNVRRWRIAYPHAFPSFVLPFSRHARIPPQLTWAIMREESGFTTRIESYANAIGLMQLILPTARAAGSHHRLHVDRKALQDPATNIKLGTTFLGFLRRTFKGVLPLNIAGYNAGQGAVYHWLVRFRGKALDELLENVPYDQTRRYTKRVMASYFAYSVLWGKKRAVPRVRLTVPRVKRLR
ncbi:MAG: tetratricopeptide repeat protein, partial [Deltaproteobacteria bacterium]|nr:tetratricopeptide repeat protein [Deltaproteobacteria bacterium]